jgi:ABC-type amino acid transport/signal transduction systems, periplasmic component/domain
MRRRLIGIAITSAAAVSLVLSGCSATAGGAGPSATNSASGTTLFKELPKNIQQSGTLTVATDPQFGPPTNFHPASDPNGWSGVEPDLLRALEPVLGVKIQWQQATFESIIPGVRSGRYDLGVNSLSDTVQREAQVDIVDWWQGVNVVIAKAGNPKHINSLKDLCGQPMAIVQGSSDQAYLTSWSAKNCNGSPIKLLTFAARPDCLLALKTDRVVATAGGTGFSINLQYNLDGKQAGASKDYQILPKVTYAPSPAGIAINKQNTQLRDTLMKAITIIMDNGTYGKILAKWHWPTDGYLTKPTLNGAAASASK